MTHRAHYSEEEKQEALEFWRTTAQQKRWSKSRVARKFRINPSTFNMWTHEDNARAEAGHPRLKESEVVEALNALNVTMKLIHLELRTMDVHLRRRLSELSESEQAKRRGRLKL
jgi:transposase-like protein